MLNILAFCLLMATPSHNDTIPFTLTSHNNISIQAILNGKDTLHLMFHTAEHGLTLTEAATARLTDLRFDGADSVKSWGGNGHSRYSKGNRLQIGDLRCDSLLVWEDKNSGQGTDGKFGPDLFGHRAVEIDFDQKRIVLLETLPSDMSGFSKLPLAGMHVNAGCAVGDSVFINAFLLHSGYSGGLLLDDAFVGAHGLDGRLQVVSEKELKDSFGHVLKVETVTVPRLVVGRDTLTSVPAGFFHGAIGRQKISLLGMEILKRFHLIIDADRAFIYLKPSLA